jgi:hypothetical protein
MNKRLISIALIVCLASLIMLGTVKAQTLTSVLSFTYKVTSHWSSSDPHATIPQELIDVNQTDSIEVRISSDGINVDTFTATFFNNGSSPIASQGKTNLQTGETQGGFAAIIRANLTQGQLIHPAANDFITINSTATRAYESGNRATNEILISVRNESAGATSSVDRFFDQATGMLVYSVESTSIDNPNSSSSVTWQIISSTAWVIPEFPVILAIPAFLIATSLAAIAFKKKHTNITIKL